MPNDEPRCVASVPPASARIHGRYVLAMHCTINGCTRATVGACRIRTPLALAVAVLLNAIACGDSVARSDSAGSASSSSATLGGDPDNRQVCERLCGCASGCEDGTTEQCKSSFDDLQELALERGCTPEYDASVGCILGDAVACDDEGDLDLESCVPDLDALVDCIEADP